MRFKTLLLASGATILALVSQPALAQADREDASAGDIIVTARKQNESILKVPVVLTALGVEQIERAQIKDLTDIGKKVTGLQFGVASVESGNLSRCAATAPTRSIRGSTPRSR